MGRYARMSAFMVACTSLFSRVACDQSGNPNEFVITPDGTRVSMKGWVHPLPDMDQELMGGVCNIDRRPHLTRAEFMKEYRYASLPRGHSYQASPGTPTQ